jgi:hypothetical protein
MTHPEMERAVCRATGESRETIRRYGFQLVEPPSEWPVDLSLALDCPGCGALIDASNRPLTALEFVECPRCDAVYPFTVDEVYVAEGAVTPLRVCA